MNKKNCIECLHVKVCKDHELIKKSISSTNRESFNDKDSLINSIANNCNNYLVYDKRSTEVFIKKVHSAISSIGWVISMCKPQGEVSKKILNGQNDKWFAKDFVGSLERTKEHLDEIVKD